MHKKLEDNMTQVVPSNIDAFEFELTHEHNINVEDNMNQNFSHQEETNNNENGEYLFQITIVTHSFYFIFFA
jgi:hypothetical protein